MKMILSLIIAIVLVACLYLRMRTNEDTEMAEGIMGNTHVCVKPGFGGDKFTIRFNADGTYRYYEGSLSSYIGFGNWSVENGIVTMIETTGRDKTFHFRLEDGALYYVTEGSSKFMHVDVVEGDKFRLE